MIRWLLFNSVTLFVVAYLLKFHDGFNWILSNDPTHLSLVIASLYVAVSAYIGIGVWRQRLEAGFLAWVPTILLALGLIGTVIGMKVVYGSLDFSDIKTAIIELSKGVGVATTTTATALITGLLLEVQTWFVTGRTGHER